MFRLSRRFTTALLWIAIALLPVRGWAALLMPISMGDMQPAAVTSAVATDAAVNVMPCHSAPQDAAADGGNSPATCSMCDLCHSTVAQAAPTSVALAEMHEALPPATASMAIEPRAPDGLFRPPRTSLA
jgi:hypothetical protein